MDERFTGPTYYYVRVIQTALRELRHAFRVFAPYAERRKVTIFGSARMQPHKVEYQQAVEFGRKIAAAGATTIVCGRGAIVLRRIGGGPLDAIGWGDAVSSFVEGSAAPAPPPGSSLERRPGGIDGNGVDTNDNATDWLDV